MPDVIFQKVAQAISKSARIPIERIEIDSTFAELGMDSLDGTTLLFELEEAFDLQIPDEALKLKTVRQVVEHLEQLDASRLSKA